MKVYTLKNGQTFTTPSLFVNPQHRLDAKSLAHTTSKSLSNIDGLVIDIMDYGEVADDLGFNSAPIVMTSQADLRDKVRFIDPSLHKLLNGSSEEKSQMLATKLFDEQITKSVRKLANPDLPNKEKPQIIINEIYPYLTVKPLIDFEVRHDASAIISPCVNISSKTYFRQQLSKATQMLVDSRILLESTDLKKYLETRDLINSLAINYKLIQPQNYSSLFKLAICNNPDQVAFKFLGIRESDSVSVPEVFAFLRNFAVYSMEMQERKEPIPIHLLNVDELGYAGYTNAVCNISCPLATSPYYSYPSKDRDEVDTSPTYYHPIDMNSPKAHSIDILPCECIECRFYNQRMSNVGSKNLALFRRNHWLYVKDGEISQFRQSRARLDIELRDKFARSMRTQLAAYLPENPLFTIY